MKPRKPKRTAKTSLIDKLSSGGTETFTGEELGRLLAAFEDQARRTYNADERCTVSLKRSSGTTSK